MRRRIAAARQGARVAVNYLKNQKGAEEAVEAIRKDGRRRAGHSC